MKLLSILNEIKIIFHNWNANNLDFEKGKNIKTAIINCLKVNKYTTEKRLIQLLYEKFRYDPQVVGGSLRKVPGVKRIQAKNPQTKRLSYLYYYEEPTQTDNPNPL